MKEKKLYEVPALTVVTFKTERGYFASETQSVWIGNENDSPNTGVEDYTVEKDNGDFFKW